MQDKTTKLIRLIEPDKNARHRKESPLERNVRRMAATRPEALAETLADMRCLATQPLPIDVRGAAEGDDAREWRLALQHHLFALRIGTMTGASDRAGNLMIHRPGRISPISQPAMIETTSRLIALERMAEEDSMPPLRWAVTDFETEVLLREEWLVYLVDDLATQAEDACQTGFANELRSLLVRMSHTIARDARKTRTVPPDTEPRIVVPTIQTKALMDAMETALS